MTIKQRIDKLEQSPESLSSLHAERAAAAISKRTAELMEDWTPLTAEEELECTLFFLRHVKESYEYKIKNGIRVDHYTRQIFELDQRIEELLNSDVCKV